MTEPVQQWENETWTGVVQSFVRKTNQNNREFAEVVIDGNLCSAWDDNVKQMAETCKDLRVRAEVRRKAGSRYWTLADIEPLADQTAPVLATAPAGQRVDEVELRLRCLDLAVRALIGRDGGDNAQVVVTYATQLENYALDVTPKPDAA